MIGDQLIKNEKVNRWSWLKILMMLMLIGCKYGSKNFTIDKDENTLIKNENSCIEIEDDGSGMTFDTIKNVWLESGNTK